MTPQVRLVATPFSGPRVELAYIVSSEKPQTLSVWATITPYQLCAYAGAVELEVIRPPLDLPAAQQLVSVEPVQRAKIPCPVILELGIDDIYRDGLTRTLRRAPAPPANEISCGLELNGVPVMTPSVHVSLDEALGEC